eukprot:10404235-Heterocapsa_arctica.AAC.1
MENTAVLIESKHTDALRRSDERYNEAVDELNLVRATASSAERTLREENYKAFTVTRADYEAKILNLT